MLFLLFHCWFLRFILLNFFWRTCQMSQSLFFFTFRHKTKKKQQTKQSFRNRKKTLCVEEKRKGEILVVELEELDELDGLVDWWIWLSWRGKKNVFFEKEKIEKICWGDCCWFEIVLLVSPLFHIPPNPQH